MSEALLTLVAILGLVILNGVFVAAEFALVSVRPNRIDQRAGQGQRLARVVQRAFENPNRFISAAQIGITMTSLGLGWLTVPALAEMLSPAFESLLDGRAGVATNIAAGAIAFLAITLVHIVLGEQVPKMLALQRSESTILATAGPVSWLSVPFRPVIALLYGLTSLALRPFGLQWQGDHHIVYSEDELKMLVTASQQSGYLELSEQEMINRVFVFADLLTEQVMVPRTEMEALQIDASLEEVTRMVAATGHARYAVYAENLDEILGIFYAKDIYRYLDRAEHGPFLLRRLMRPPLMVPNTMPLDDLLTQMKRKRTHIAIVVDEYGGTAGMVTLEDVLERIVGDVQDEFEAQVEDIQILDNGHVRISGLLTIADANERFGLKLDEPYYNTVGGYVFGQLGRRPEIGDAIELGDYLLKVEALDGLRIDRLILVARETEPPMDAEPASLQQIES